MNTLTKIKNGVLGFFEKFIISKPVKLWKWIKPKPLRFIIKFAAFLCAAVYPVLCLLGLEYMNYGNKEKFMTLFKTRPKVIALDLIIFYLFFVVLILLVKRVWIACAAMGTLSTVLSIASFLKYRNVGEYLYPWDLQQTGNVGTLTEYINTPLYKSYFIIIGVLALTAAFIGFSRLSLRIRWNFRIPAAIITVLTVFNVCFTPEMSTKILVSHSMSLVDGALQTSNYDQNGFVGATTVNIMSDILAEPEGYSEDRINEILAGYEYKKAGENFKKPNVILILQESFYDITKLPGIDFSDDPIKNFREICGRDRAYSGVFISNAFGGGTVRPEFEVLTGMTTDALPGGCVPYQYLKKNMESYPLMFKNMGYKTMALHPYIPSFYLRNTKYPLIGFDETYFESDLLRDKPEYYEARGGNVSDNSFVNYLEYYIDQCGDEPVFMFGISMASHQPFDNKFKEEELELTVTSDVLDPGTLHTVKMFTQRDVDADRAIAKLVDYVDNCERDTVLILFGDHAPTLGAEYAAYVQTGIRPADSMLTLEQSLYVSGTPFLIYSNFDLEPSTMIEKTAGADIGDQYISSYNLFNAAMEMMDGPETPLMGFLRDFHQVCPYYNSRMHVVDTEEVLEFFKAHKMITYDRMRGSRFSLKEFDE